MDVIIPLIAHTSTCSSPVITPQYEVLCKLIVDRELVPKLVALLGEWEAEDEILASGCVNNSVCVSE